MKGRGSSGAERREPHDLEGPVDSLLGLARQNQKLRGEQLVQDRWVRRVPIGFLVDRFGPSPTVKMLRGVRNRFGCGTLTSPWQKSSRHSTVPASRRTALRLGHILPVCSLIAPCPAGAGTVSVLARLSPRAVTSVRRGTGRIRSGQNRPLVTAGCKQDRNQNGANARSLEDRPQGLATTKFRSLSKLHRISHRSQIIKQQPELLSWPGFFTGSLNI